MEVAVDLFDNAWVIVHEYLAHSFELLDGFDHIDNIDVFMKFLQPSIINLFLWSLGQPATAAEHFVVAVSKPGGKKREEPNLNR